MLRKLMIRTWFGDLPPWTSQFVEHIQHLKQYGWDFKLIDDYDWFANEVKLQLSVDLPPESSINRRKAGDWDPYLGSILQKYLKMEKYDYWVHINLDAVYGRLDRWLPDSFLQNIDIFGNDPGAICGPFTVYRNCSRINELFRLCPTWEDNLRDPNFRGWDELDFNRTVQQEVLAGRVVMASGFLQAHDHIDDAHTRHQETGKSYVRINGDGSLTDLLWGKEVMMFHYNQARHYPVCQE